MNNTLKDFIEYCSDFYYNDSAIYPYENLTKAALTNACKLVANRKDISFYGDSADREKVEEILQSRGYRKLK